MKTNTIFKFIAVALSSAVLLTSCAEETFPENGYATSDQIAESPFATGGVLSAIPTILMSNYSEILGEHVEFGYMGLAGALDRMTGDMFPVSGNVEGGNPYYDRWQFATYPCTLLWLNNNSYASLWFYKSYYQFLYTANSAVSILGSATEPTAELGVALAYRALINSDMARMYDPLDAVADPAAKVQYSVPGEVKGLTMPLITESMTLEQMENNPRQPREAMWAYILNDLNKAEELMIADAGYTRPTIGIPNLAVVYGLKARAYLWLGGFSEVYGDVAVPGLAEGDAVTVKVPTGSDAYRLAAEYARKAINASGCTIMSEAQWLDKTTGFCVANNSWMLGLKQSTDTVLNNLYAWTAHMSIEAIWGYGYGSQPGVSNKFYDRMDANDFRKKNIVTPDRSWSAIKDYTVLTEEEFNGSEGSPIAPYAWIKFHTNGGEKFDYSKGNVTDIPLMRVEEMYLIEAEATAHYDEATGKSLLEAFMATRAPGYTYFGTDLVEEIIFQKRAEFWGEGIVIFDMKRMDIGWSNADNSNSPVYNRITTNGRAPWWNLTLPETAEQQNAGIRGFNNPNPCNTYISND